MSDTKPCESRHPTFGIQCRRDADGGFHNSHDAWLDADHLVSWMEDMPSSSSEPKEGVPDTTCDACGVIEITDGTGEGYRDLPLRDSKGNVLARIKAAAPAVSGETLESRLARGDYVSHHEMLTELSRLSEENERLRDEVKSLEVQLESETHRRD
jgi:hypothetical protein